MSGDQTRSVYAIQQDLTLVRDKLYHYQQIQTLGYSLKLDNLRTKTLFCQEQGKIKTSKSDRKHHPANELLP
ncbi:hypothetical protein A6770_33320 [Nostoc minutum NIES-26]|uniref:Uncharacterized protein n=1 Tax=Nostoc minutum NIES-26 TaxID=1844469 RepID=A0A367Q1Y4_9NOSO|nr:hypothetical protein A6770_33320 [Nostoc minutum NIES-26]